MYARHLPYILLQEWYSPALCLATSWIERLSYATSSECPGWSLYYKVIAVQQRCFGCCRWSEKWRITNKCRLWGHAWALNIIYLSKLSRFIVFIYLQAGNTPLCIAVNIGSVKLVSQLLQSGASVNFPCGNVCKRATTYMCIYIIYLLYIIESYFAGPWWDSTSHGS